MLRTFVCAALALILMSGVSFAGVKGKGKKGQAVRGTIKKIDAKQGTLTVAVDRVFPLSKAADAHRYLAGRNQFGKVLLAP